MDDLFLWKCPICENDNRLKVKVNDNFNKYSSVCNKCSNTFVLNIKIVNCNNVRLMDLININLYDNEQL